MKRNVPNGDTYGGNDPLPRLKAWVSIGRIAPHLGKTPLSRIIIFPYVSSYYVFIDVTHRAIKVSTPPPKKSPG